jgi:pimeloyl-ACP methyl ester carboxylesterase
LTFTHLPERPAAAGVVVCSPIGSERIRNHRREFELAASLAERGVAVERFHYRCAGDSDGDSEGLGFDTMREDAVASALRLLQREGLSRVAFLGTRLGGLVASSAAAEFPDAALALWEPVVDPVAYFDEVFRYKLIQDVMHSRFESAASRSTLGQELGERGFTDVLGFPLTRRLYDEAVAHDLESELSGFDRPMMIAQIRADASLDPGYSDLARRLVAAGSEVETAVFPERIAWWFLAKVFQHQAFDDSIVATTASWLEAQLADR